MTALKIADLQRDAYTEGREEGISLGIERGREEGISLGREEGISLGMERGAYQKALETARSFLFYGDSPEKVAFCTGLPLETVISLLEQDSSSNPS